MQSFQRFRLGDIVEPLAVSQDYDDPPYSQLDDIQETFPSATRFKLDGVTLNFLADKSGKKYDIGLVETKVLLGDEPFFWKQC